MNALFPDLDTGATFSPCGTYRYRLWRIWDETSPAVNFIMLNPSTADAIANDPTVERCVRRAKALGYGGLVVTNLFAFRATDPGDMKAAGDPVGEENDAWLCQEAERCLVSIAAWGNHGSHLGRSEYVRKMLGKPLCYLRLTKTGEPEHPLYVPYEVRPTEWRAP